MNTREKVLVGVCAFFIFVAATQFAMRGVHNPSGNTGWLGTEVAGVEGQGAGLNPGVYGRNSIGFNGVLGSSLAGVRGQSGDGSTEGRLATIDAGVYGAATCSNCTGVYAVTGGNSTRAMTAIGVSSDTGLYAISYGGFAVHGQTTDGTALYGIVTAPGIGHAGYFDGRVHVNGTLSKSAGSFRIDHPLEPATKYLSHSFVESPDMKNIYDGVAVLDAKGSAVVELPAWFEALNKDFRYQLTTIGEHAPVYIADEIHEHRFRIAGGYAGMKVSWQVTGSRQDAYAKAYPIPVEEAKAPHELGRFLHPELFGAPMTQRVSAAPPAR